MSRRCKPPSTGTTPDTGAAPCVGVAHSLTQPPGRGRRSMRALKDMSGPPTFCSIRTTGTNAGSPTGRESYGDGGLVVVAGVTTCQGGRESRPQGEGGQVTGDRCTGRYAQCGSPQRSLISTVCAAALTATVAGEPDDRKRSSPVRAGGRWKRTTPGTSPAAYRYHALDILV